MPNRFPEMTNNGAYLPPDNRPWQIAALMVASGCSTRKIAEYTKVSVGVISKWRRHPRFKKYVEQVHRQSIEEAVGYLRMVVLTTTRRLHELKNSCDERVALAACKEIREAYKQYKDDLSITSRIEQLEELYNSKVNELNEQQHGLSQRFAQSPPHPDDCPSHRPEPNGS